MQSGHICVCAGSVQAITMDLGNKAAAASVSNGGIVYHVLW